MEFVMKKNSELIISIINESDEHLTAEQIFFKAKEINPKIVLATVYNNLNKLTDEGKIRRLNFQGMTAFYDKVIRHDHLICKRCGKVQDVYLDDLSKMIDKKLHIKIISYDMDIYYICEECLNKKEETT